MSENTFRIRETSTGYDVEFYRDGAPYVTFLKGLSEQRAEREARNLNALWLRIGSRASQTEPVAGGEQGVPTPTQSQSVQTV